MRHFLLALATPFLVFCNFQPVGAQTVATTNDRAAPLSAHELGRKIYNFRCYYCHGYSGNAKTLASSYLTPKPRDFTATSLIELSREKMLTAVQNGRPLTAMKSFKGILQPDEMEAVVDFIRSEFMLTQAENTRYHTAENGWPDHETKYAAAIPFATWKIPLDTPWDKLPPRQQAGKRLFMSACVTCHDRARVNDEGAAWEGRPLSYPRNNYSPAAPLDAVTSASPYAKHDQAPQIPDLSKLEKRGETLFQQNCAFCHAADGTARNWIGSFLQPHPRDLVSSPVMAGMTKSKLHNVIRDGLPGTSMPAWKHVLEENDVQAVIAYISRAFHPIPD